MKKIHVLVLFLITIVTVECYATDTIKYNSDTLKIATYNIRIQTKNDRNFHSWKNRKSAVAKLIASNKIDICSVQEMKDKRQEKELLNLLPDFSLYSKGRNNRRGSRGERLGILYNKTLFQQKESGFFFLSPTPTRSSKGWGASTNRICVWVKLYDINNKKNIYIFNTHFDHKSITAREKSAELVSSEIKKIAKNESIIFCGDFNSSPNETNLHNTIKTGLDNSEQITECKLNTTMGTYNGWKDSISSFPDSDKIDYIYCKNIEVFIYDVLSTKTANDSYPSDHFPVVISCRINN